MWGKTIILRLIGMLVLSVTLASGSFGQTTYPTVFPQPVLVLDKDALFIRSDLGKSILATELRNRELVLTESNSIANSFEHEEQQLTEKRLGMSADAFKVLSDDFDARVQDMRAAQLGKDLALQKDAETNRRRFFTLAVPYLSRIMLKYNASAILDQRSLLLFNKDMNITTEAIDLLDEAFAVNPEMFEQGE